MSLEGKLLDHYRILHLIGSGGMGTVYVAEDSQIQRQVAVKVMKIESTQPDEEVIAKTLRLFLREARAIASLDHPNILPLYDYGQEMIDSTYFAYLIIPYRAEGSLMNWLRKRARTQKTKLLTLKQIDHLIQQANKALQYAHDHQIIHQDVKPANFLIRSTSDADEYPDLQLSDFGIARHLANTTASISQHMLGTPTYMAPEQWAGEPVFASDQYALAVMAYELLAGRPPFQGTPLNMMYLHAQKPPQPLRELKPLLPSAVDTVLLRALAKKPEERFSSVAAFAHAFQEAISDREEGIEQRVIQPSPSLQQTPDKPGFGDIQAMLAISAEEAQNGTSRVLTLSNGRTVGVQIPPRARSGQMLTLAGRGEILSPGGVAGNLYLILSVVEEQPRPTEPSNENVPTYRDLRLDPSIQIPQSPSVPSEPVSPLQQRFAQSPVPSAQAASATQASVALPPVTPTFPVPLLSTSYPLPVSPRPRHLSLTITALLAFVLLLAIGGGVISFTLLSRHGTSPSTVANIGQTTTTTTVKVATELPTSGVDTTIGVSTRNGAELAVIQANEKHTVPNVTFQLVNKNDVGPSGVHDPAVGAANVQELLGDPQVAGIVGPFNSGVAKAEMPIANNGNIALISPSNTNPCLTKEGDVVGCGGANDLVHTLRPTGNVTYFRLAATDDHQGPAMADYLYTTLHLKKAYVVDDTEIYGAGLALYFVQEWIKLGGTVIEGRSHSVQSTTDYTNLLTAAAAQHPDVLYFGGTYATGGQVIQQQMTKIPGLEKTVYAGGDGLIGNPDFYKQITDDAGQCYITVAHADPSKIPAASQFIKDYTARYGAVGSYSAEAFDVMNILIQAIKKALSTTSAAQDANDTAGANTFRTAVISALKQTDYRGVTGHTTFDTNGDTTNKVFTLHKVALVNGTPDLETEAVITVQ
jgi:branched-chain amino acid transport system substrate-binding protein